VSINREKMIEVGAQALAGADPYDNDWTPEATAVVDAILPLLGDDDFEPHARRNSPTTSHEVFDKIRRSSLQERLLYLFTQAPDGGFTDDELEVKTGLSHQSVSASRNTLMHKGYVVDSGSKRRTRSGNRAIVYIWTRKVWKS